MCRRARSTNLSRILLLIFLMRSPGALEAEQYVLQEVMSGLASPRGLAFGPDGGLYVAEAGSGGNGPGIVLGSGNAATYATSGGLSPIAQRRAGALTRFFY